MVEVGHITSARKKSVHWKDGNRWRLRVTGPNHRDIRTEHPISTSRPTNSVTKHLLTRINPVGVESTIACILLMSMLFRHGSDGSHPFHSLPRIRLIWLPTAETMGLQRIKKSLMILRSEERREGEEGGYR